MLCVEHASQPLLQNGHVEVDQQAGRAARQTQIRLELRTVHGRYERDGLDFDDYYPGNNQVQPKAAVENYAFVHDWKWLLNLVRQAGLPQFMQQAREIYGLK